MTEALFSGTFFFNTDMIHIRMQTSDHTKLQLVAGDAAPSLFLPVLQAKEG